MESVTIKRRRKIVNGILRVRDSEAGKNKTWYDPKGKRLLTLDHYGAWEWSQPERAIEFAWDILQALLNYRRDHPDAQMEIRVPIEPNFKLTVEADGEMKFAPIPEILLSLDGLNLDYIRRCAICNREFYASREDSRACSKRHNSTLRQREYRQDLRAENRERKKTSRRMK